MSLGNVARRKRRPISVSAGGRPAPVYDQKLTQPALGPMPANVSGVFTATFQVPWPPME